MMNYDDGSAEQLEAQRLRQEEEQRRQEEERKKREEEMRRQQMAAQQQSPAMGGINPAGLMGMMSTGGSPAAGGIAGAEGAGGAGAAGGAGTSSMGSMGSAWPLAVAAVVLAHNQWTKKKGLHDNLDAIDGRALYKDSAYYQEKGNAKLDGLGDEMRLAAMGSSPADLFRKDTWKTAVELAAKGGILGSVIKKIF